MNHLINEPKTIRASQEREVSPIERKMVDLREVLECAHEGLSLLSSKLAPVRAACPTGDDCGEKAVEAACEIEQRLQYLIDSAAKLSRNLSDLRSELRI